MQTASQVRQIGSSSAQPSNSMRPITTPFKKASSEPKTLEVLPILHSKNADVWFTTKFMQKTHQFLLTLSVKLEQRTPKLISLFCSLFSVLCHLGFQGYLIYKFMLEPTVMICFCVILAAIVFFAGVTTAKLWYTIEEKDSSKCIVENHIVATLVYLALSCVSVVYISSIYRGYALLMLGFVVLSCNVISGYIVCSILFISGLLLLVCGEGFYKLVTCNLSRQSRKKMKLKYETYYYECGKCSTKDCAICLHEHKENEVICVLKCHKTHIFHEQCIVEWVVKQPICPICRSPAGFV